MMRLNGKSVLLVLVTGISAGVALLVLMFSLFAQSDNDPTKSILEVSVKEPGGFPFGEVNPPSAIRATGVSIHIWTSKNTFLRDEPVPLYIEFLREIPREKPSLTAVRNPMREPFDPAPLQVWKQQVGCLRTTSEGDGHRGFSYQYEGDYIPTKDEIPPERLHGNLKFPVKNRAGRFVYLKKGDCFVVRIHNIMKYIDLPRGEDIRGFYKVQYMYSNIIEFEIR